MLVLIADADLSACDAARRSVERFGYRCVVASNGADAWDRFLADSPDVILASLDLPTVSGVEVCRRARTSTRSPASYLVAIVGHDDGEGLFAAMATGADDFLIRPYHPEQLHARLQVAERFLLQQRRQMDCQADLDRTRRALKASARTDPLTQLWNRQHLNDDLELFQGQLLRYGHRYAAAIIDLDRFGLYNETNGQLAGDEALRVVAQTVARQLRTGDRAYRYGGDELAVLLPEQSLSSARIAVERIREAVDGLGLPHPGNPPWNLVTVSTGVAAFGTDGVTTYDALCGRAEAALRRARAEGGNRVAFEH